MIGKIIDMSFTDAFISFEDGTTLDIGISSLPPNCKIGDTINFNPKNIELKNDKLINLF
ncbi:hypothetical protein HBE96_02615 [Clostridium sp. P21]|uniref:S1 motif domain-containing protein n=1 Tax=Clostridium muellerianum TaxID=2716538 RepID=A0A7Y0EDV0_9CLOT|nr:hypothetical protein [Clostridium muellerianum]NMM61603.1 hypothetical protein [Clostridium muellerianum]